MKRDEKIFSLINEERERQTKGLELIASENFVSAQYGFSYTTSELWEFLAKVYKH